MLFVKTERQVCEGIRAQGPASIYSHPVGSIHSDQTGVGWTSRGMAGHPGGEQNPGLQLPYSHLWRTARSRSWCDVQPQAEPGPVQGSLREQLSA